MRKWTRITVGLLLLLVVILVPKSETELHKRRCQAAWNKLTGKSVTERIKCVYYQVTKTTPKRDWWNETYRDLESSRQALMELGYITSGRVEVTNAVARTVPDEFNAIGYEAAFVWADWDGNSVILCAPVSEFVRLSNHVRRINATTK